MPRTISPSSLWASIRASFGVQGEPCRPIVIHPWRPLTRYLRMYTRRPFGAIRKPKPEISESQAVYRVASGLRESMFRLVSAIVDMKTHPGYQMATNENHKPGKVGKLHERDDPINQLVILQ